LKTWPSLPKPEIPLLGRDISKLDARTQWELEKIKKHEGKSENRDLQPADKDYPLGDFYGTGASEDVFSGFYA
jgi:hypothetical protein